MAVVIFKRSPMAIENELGKKCVQEGEDQTRKIVYSFKKGKKKNLRKLKFGQPKIFLVW